MFQIIKEKYRELLLSLQQSLEKPEAGGPAPQNPTGGSTGSENASVTQIWKKEFQPLRQIVLWGRDQEGNPGFLMLYGRQGFTERTDEKTKSTYNVLNDTVQYTGYAVFKGRGGHLPSFAAVKLVDERLGYYHDAKAQPELYYKQGVQRWHKDQDYQVETYQNFPPEQPVTFSYCNDYSHAQYVQEMQRRNLSFPGFTLVENPAEILKLDGLFAGDPAMIAEMMSDPRIYIRKKRLNQLLAQEPAPELLIRLLEIGSTELVSGLFLELAKTGAPVLVTEAKEMMDGELSWACGNYAKGVKRCARLYWQALNPEVKANRIKWIRQHLQNMDLHLIRLRGREVPEDQVITGSAYRSYAQSGLLSDYNQEYDYQQRQYIKSAAPLRYQAGPYTDGAKLKIIDFKSTIQEAEIYGLADVIGKVAYYLDAPRLTYYFQGNGKTRALHYFQRLVRRIIDGYAQHNPEQFMTAMKQLLTSYTTADYVCKFRDNFQFNLLLKHYLYYDFHDTPPEGWYARYEWLANDQLLGLEGRYEMRRDIWDNHLEVVADIAMGAKVNLIWKACYYILKDSPHSQSFIASMPYRQLIGLAQVGYSPLAEWFSTILLNRLNQLTAFDPELMLALINCPDEKIQRLAMDFFQKTNGSFGAATIAELLLLDEPGRWVELFSQNLFALGSEQYAVFIRHILDRNRPFLANLRELPEQIQDVLAQSVTQVRGLATPEKGALLAEIIRLLQQKAKLPEWVEVWLENLIFALDDELEGLMAQISVEPAPGAVPARNKRILGLLEALRTGQTPPDSQIIAILEQGSSKMVNCLIRMLAEHPEELKTRPATLLVMLESEVTALNKQAEALFDSLPEVQQRRVHALIIDSPVSRAYLLGLQKLDAIYGEQIPEAFIIQLLEHGAEEVKAYISGKINRIINDLGAADQNLFWYYTKTLLLLPNKVSKGKDRVYAVLPQFARQYPERLKEIEEMLLDIGGSNIRLDAERALVTLGKIRREVVQREG